MKQNASLTLDRNLITRLDVDAKRFHRSRSAMLNEILIEYYEDDERVAEQGDNKL